LTDPSAPIYKFAMRIFSKMIVGYFIATNLVYNVFGEQPVRIWTDTSGRTIKARLMAKDEHNAEVMLANGKRVKLPLVKLSPDDKKYVEESDVNPEPEIVVKTAIVKSNEAGTQRDERKIIVTVSDADGRDLRVRVVWIGDDGDKAKYGKYFEEIKTVTTSGEYPFTAIYQRNGSKLNDDNYKGYAVQLLGKDDKIIDVEASQKPYERFLSE